MGIRLLGPLEVDGTTHLSPRERTVLAALALRAGRPVHPEELADACWGDDLPATWPKQIQASISRLRKCLPDGSVRTTGAGYVLAIAADDLDSLRFEELMKRARTLLGEGEPELAQALLTRALQLWRGNAYDDLREWEAGASEVARLEELRSTALEDSLEARLERGEHHEVAADAEAAVRGEPLRERRWAVLALAQYRAGRQGDALSTLRRARRVLDEELGVEPGAALRELEASILHQDATLEAVERSTTTSTDCPYKGLAAYEMSDADSLFGRDEEIVECLARLQRVGLLVLSGPSGCGKSSLLRAGLAATLARRGAEVCLVVPGSTPSTTLEAALASCDPDAVLVVDQVEQLFAFGLEPGEVQRYCRTVAAHAENGGLVLLGVRADALAKLGVSPDLAGPVEKGLHLVPPLLGDSLRAAIEEPARRAGLRLEHGLVDLLLRDVGGDVGALPMLSHALAETWRRRDGNVLTVEGYEASGGLSGAVARSADRLYEGLPGVERTMCRSLFLRLVVQPGDGPLVGVRLPRAAVPAGNNSEQVLDHLVDARLLTRYEGGVEIAHESLTRAWPRLRSWLDEDAVGVRLMRHLVATSEGWDALGRPSTELYRGARLDAALEWSGAAPVDLTTVERDFLAASTRERDSGLDAERARAAAQRRQNRRLRISLVAAAALLAVSLVASSLAVRGGIEAAAQGDAAAAARDEAELEALVARSLQLRPLNRSVAALLAVEAARRWPGSALATSALIGTFTGAPGFVSDTWMQEQSGVSATGALIPGTSLAVVAPGGVRPRVVDLNTGEQEARFAGEGDLDGGPGTYVGIDQAGTTLVHAPLGTGPCEQNPADLAPIVWTGPGAPECMNLFTFDLATGTPLLDLMLPTWAAALAISPDGDLIAAVDATGGADGVVLDARTGDVVTVLPAAPLSDEHAFYGARMVTFVDDDTLWLSSSSGDLRKVDARTGDVRQVLDVGELAANVELISLSEGRLLTIGDRALSMVDTGSGETVWSQQIASNRRSSCPWVAASDVNGRFYCGTYHGRIEERDLTTGLPTGVVMLTGHGNVGQMVVTPDGRELVAFSEAAPVVSRWRLDGSGPITDLVAEGYFPLAGFDAAGERLLVELRPPGLDWSDHSFWEDPVPWDVVTNRPVEGYAPAEVAIPTGSHTVVFDSASGKLSSVDNATGDRVPLTAWADAWRDWPVVGGEYRLFGFENRVEIADMATGRQAGATIMTDGVAMEASATADLSRVLVVTYDEAITRVDGSGLAARMYDGRTGEPVSDPVGYATNAVVAGDIVAIATTSALALYSADTLEPLRVLPGVGGEVSSTQLSADGSVLLLTTRDGRVSLVDTASGAVLGEMPPSSISVYSADSIITPAYLRPDGQGVAQAGKYGVLIWDFQPEEMLEAACRMAGRDLTRAEWQAYLHALGEYRSTCDL